MAVASENEIDQNDICINCDLSNGNNLCKNVNLVHFNICSLEIRLLKF